jgi:hypothetical protein
MYVVDKAPKPRGRFDFDDAALVVLVDDGPAPDPFVRDAQRLGPNVVERDRVGSAPEATVLGPGVRAGTVLTQTSEESTQRGSAPEKGDRETPQLRPTAPDRQAL